MLQKSQERSNKNTLLVSSLNSSSSIDDKIDLNGSGNMSRMYPSIDYIGLYSLFLFFLGPGRSASELNVIKKADDRVVKEKIKCRMNLLRRSDF